MKILLRPLQWIYSIYAFITFVAVMLLIFPFAIIASFFGRIKGGNMTIRLCMLWADLWFPMIFIWHKKIYETPHDKTRSYIFVSNHISYLDAAIIVKAYRQPIRPLGKVEMSKVPVFGLIYRNAIVTVDRSSPVNRANSVRILKSLISKGISVLVFPEGTFNMGTTPLKEFYDGAFRVAIETQTPVKPVLFLDAYRRMNYKSLFSMKPGQSRILYLDEIPVAGYTSNDVEKLKQEVYQIMERKLIEYDAAWRKPLNPPLGGE
ncbi:MAG: 1-acyl-sn-glycerol-3-phosphate acyltransferase [Chitinophagaceae bacterium]|jgi:1-acyl-sn-glycerol-3-phosphate acyltransferase|nr:1-acyl-sn-glycerol-3-phosphate acyltransferase [Chitinophagaceae bacterium]MBK7678203.1 1-acyl-sn-glycerol-3-phosphate acyltransferase [Chitinophagaceae bacterium]MBK8301593.1 1-acyl-sn-glycerol-3-phosphate acyltransferase [Chitinophagaceae bacterium]MBK9464507.1 1-acyl-sn-glycerol-3-phosphate acyltransferase [Chitinophagaceae bacterium]MBK9939161.1 1-acyl-sn-glycerol-3-phosphate acyltransferase [Chitinophagaceae bacterium]